MNIPIIRLEIQGMQHTVMTALTQYAAKMDADIQAAVSEAITEEKVIALIKKTADEEINRCIANEIREFYSRGAGMQAVRRAVNATLNEKAKFMQENGLT